MHTKLSAIKAKVIIDNGSEVIDQGDKSSGRRCLCCQYRHIFFVYMLNVNGILGVRILHALLLLLAGWVYMILMLFDCCIVLILRPIYPTINTHDTVIGVDKHIAE